MRRALWLISILLLLSLATNLVIAWSCAMFADPGRGSPPSPFGIDPLLVARVRREFFERPGPDPGGSDPGTLFVSVAHECFGAQFLDVAVEDDDIPADAFNGPLPYIGYVRAGWPMLMFEGGLHRDASRSPTPAPSKSEWAFVINGRHVKANRLLLPRMLPLRPMWPGAVGNVAFWFGVLLAAWLMWTIIHRLIRCRRRLCGQCGYPIGDSPVCTECGRRHRRKRGAESPAAATLKA